jgi:hypothetical protein
MKTRPKLYKYKGEWRTGDEIATLTRLPRRTVYYRLNRGVAPDNPLLPGCGPKRMRLSYRGEQLTSTRSHYVLACARCRSTRTMTAFAIMKSRTDAASKNKGVLEMFNSGKAPKFAGASNSALMNSNAYAPTVNVHVERGAQERQLAQRIAGHVGDAVTTRRPTGPGTAARKK